jgi:CheY-like chemotaxis protein
METEAKTLLIIEDELDLRELMLAQFTVMGWAVAFDLTFSGIKRLLLTSSAVLMDWHLPGLDSDEIYRMCRRSRPCTVISGDPECPAPGALLKPFKLTEVLTLCEESIRRAKLGLDFFEGDQVESKATPAWGTGVVVDVYGDECWVQFASRDLKDRPLRVLNSHLKKV